MNVPVIDISGFKVGSEAERRAIAAQVDRAASDVGFMQIAGHGIPTTAVAGLTEAIDGFFGLPPVDKAKWRPTSVQVNRGYSGPLSERLSYSLGVATAADLFEAFNVGTPASAYPGLSLDPVHYPENLWPDRPAGFRAAVEAWFAHAGTLARDLTRIFELALGLPAHYFAAFQDHSLDVLRLNHYAMPPGASRASDDQMGMGAHTDYGIVTVLWADPVTPGLQILDPAGRWHDVVPVSGGLLVNLGDLLARWTNHRWLSTMHRVLPPIDLNGEVTRRRSAAYFHDGNADAIIACLPSCQDADHPPLYEPVTVAEHLAAKLGGSRALKLNPDAGREASRLTVAGN
jgi:isopenicillin N synthase-like dioxygenase